MARPGFAPDFAFYWDSARTLWAGGDPYQQPPIGAFNPGHDPALYPLPAYLLVVPFARLPVHIAGGIFVAIGAGLAAWGVARTGAERLPLFLSAPFLMAASLGQWALPMVAAAIVPAAGILLPVKPNLGLAGWVARPSRRTAVLAGLLVLASLIVLPAWPAEWLSHLHGREEKFVPVLRPGGVLLLAVLIAARRPEGRLVAVLSVVPQQLFFYDQLLLWLVPRTLRQSLLFSLASVVLFLVWRLRLHPGDYEAHLAVPYAFALYPMAAAIVLWNWHRDRSRGATPA